MINIQKTLHCSVFALAAMALAAGIAAPRHVRAAEMGLTDNPYAAVYAEEVCRKARFTQDEWRKIIAYVGKTSGTGAKSQITELAETRQQVLELKHKTHCFADGIMLLRTSFAGKIAPGIDM